ncbi:MAG: hypothetical protein KKB81_02820 [Candidatus Margulisbacteria bacterium]|nr:hypothetical protein [Candidatus Margulisiibacteriota bacterium]MBU1022184.1 hypothetical protein [Candidatus Margulisiibacteriota bacterium]MBU1729377.1 hypothetical protein [Candidatus Margulisiibacteriota bacterium]MBU1955650.1 hypothetical protein [Candidatus Margulisiibacteriota bacterium]
MLTNDQIKQFQILYKNRFGVEISGKEARENGERLIGLVRAVYQPKAVSKNHIKTEALK